MKRTNIDYCKSCNKVIFIGSDNTTPFEDYKRKLIHDSFKCYNFKHYKKLFEKLEDDLSIFREDLKEINEIMF